MLEYSDFYDIAIYANEHWNGSFTPKEIAENAYNYTCDFEWSKENGKFANSIRNLLGNLEEDLLSEDDADVEYWTNEIRKELQETWDSSSCPCKGCMYIEICGNLLRTKECKDRTCFKKNAKPDKHGYVEYCVTTSYPYVTAYCNNITQARKAKSKLHKIGRKAFEVSALTPRGCDYLVKI